MAAVVVRIAAAECRYVLAATGSSSWKAELAGGSGAAQYWKAAQLRQLCGVVNPYSCSLHLWSYGS